MVLLNNLDYNYIYFLLFLGIVVASTTLLLTPKQIDVKALLIAEMKRMRKSKLLPPTIHIARYQKYIKIIPRVISKQKNKNFIYIRFYYEMGSNLKSTLVTVPMNVYSYSTFVPLSDGDIVYISMHRIEWNTIFLNVDSYKTFYINGCYVNGERKGAFNRFYDKS